jgi:heme/copper-type cytochrome/quinol oxidase subunit 2
MNSILTKRFISVAAMAIVLVLLCQATAMACPTCKDSLANGQSNLVHGYFWSILFMMSMPFLILAGLGSYFYWEVCRARARAAAAQAAAASQSFDSDSAAPKPARRTSRRREPVEV